MDVGSDHGDDFLFERVYNELRKLAQQRINAERVGHTLTATALVHDAYLRLLNDQQVWDNDRHFFGAAAEAMRRILIENARQKQSLKRAGGRARVELNEDLLPGRPQSVVMLDLDEAICQLEEFEPQKAEVVKLRYFAGLTIDETAKVMGISSATVKRAWVFSKAWLNSRLRT